MTRPALPLLLLLAACANAAESPAPAAATPEREVNTECDLRQLDKFVGQPASPALAAEAQKLSGTRTVRWKAPGQAVTMDYSPSRLNIQIDETQKVIGFDCG